jgi:hypothetical protein
MPADTLDTVKQRLRNRYLGRAGIHGLGVSPAQNAIRVYIHPGRADTEAVLRQLEAEARPHRVVVVQEEPPALT